MLPTRTRPPSLWWQMLLVLAAVDSTAAGAWALLRPDDLFRLLQCPPSADRLLLCRALGFLFLTHAPCLLLAAFRPGFAGLTLLPLSGRLLSSGVWLWLLGACRMVAAQADPALHGGPERVWPWLLGSGDLAAVGGVLTALLLHDAVWPPLLAAFLAMRRADRAAARPVRDGASPGPALPASPPAPPA